MCPESWSRFCQFLFNWQTLIMGLMALASAVAGVAYLHRQIRQTEELEDKRRERKLAAVKAVGPLALSIIGDYAKQCTDALKDLHHQCGNNPALPPSGVVSPAVPPVPKETVTLFSEFIEYSEGADADLIEELMRDIQVQQSRLRGVVSNIANPNMMVTKRNIEEYLIDAGSVYAKGAASFDFFRRRSKKLPAEITWDQVKSGLRIMDVDETRYPDVFARIDQLAAQSTGPKRWADRP